MVNGNDQIIKIKMKNENQILEYLAKEIAQIKSTQYEVGTKINLLYNKFCPESDFLTPKEITKMTGWSRSKINRVAKESDIIDKTIRGTHRKYRRSEILKLI
jgi:hypothetical protein